MQTIDIGKECFKAVKDNPGIISPAVAKLLKMEDDLNCIRWHLFLLRRDGKITQNTKIPVQDFPKDSLDKEWELVQPSIRIDP